MDTAPPNCYLEDLNTLACPQSLTKNQLTSKLQLRAKINLKLQQKKHHDKHKSFLPLLSPGQFVSMQDPQSCIWRENGHVISVRPNGLSCLIEVNHKWLSIYARRMLRPTQPWTADIEHSSVPTYVYLQPAIPIAAEPSFVPLCRSKRIHDLDLQVVSNNPFSFCLGMSAYKIKVHCHIIP